MELKCFSKSNFNPMIKAIVFVISLGINFSFSQNNLHRENLLDYVQNQTDTDVLLVQKMAKLFLNIFQKIGMLASHTSYGR